MCLTFDKRTLADMILAGTLKSSSTFLLFLLFIYLPRREYLGRAETHYTELTCLSYPSQSHPDKLIIGQLTPGMSESPAQIRRICSMAHPKSPTWRLMSQINTHVLSHWELRQFVTQHYYGNISLILNARWIVLWKPVQNLSNVWLIVSCHT